MNTFFHETKITENIHLKLLNMKPFVLFPVTYGTPMFKELIVKTDENFNFGNYFRWHGFLVAGVYFILLLISQARIPFFGPAICLVIKS